MPATYVTHARTPQELRAEVVSDLNRRLLFLNGQVKTIARSASEKARIGRAIVELEDMLDFWSKLTIEKTVRKRPNSAQVAEIVAKEAQSRFDA